MTRSASPKQGYRAGLISRAAAAAIDIIVVALVASALYLGVTGVIFAIRPRGFHFPRPDLGLTILVCSSLAVTYLGICWSASGRTVGDQLAGLRILERSGTRVRPLVAYARALACVIFPAGLLWCAFSRDNLSLQDVIFRTVVVYDWSRRVPGREARA
jgi:uncharacterized RDD family membrane protein YckC